jgi:hypothetical protein
MDFWRGWSASFLITGALLLATVAGYAAWRVWRPNPVARSEGVVREFAADARKLVGSHRRWLTAATRDRGGSPAGVTAREAPIDTRTEEVLASLRTLAETAEAELDEIEGISLRTLRNRLTRVDRRFEEAAAMLRDEAGRAKNEVRGQATPALSTPVP